MAYAKKTWTLDDSITDVALNNIETGVDTAHDVLDATGTPTGLSAATPNAIGTAAAKAKADHTHAIASNVMPTTLAAGASAEIGTSSHLARADHKHAISSNVMPTTLAAGASAEIGTGSHLARADHKHAISASGTPSTQAFGDSAVVGTSTHLARADHKHAMPTGTISWTSATLSGSWENYGPPYYSAAYSKDLFGVVRLRGRVHIPSSTVSGPSTIFRLGSGYRPASEMSFHVSGADASGANIKIGADGYVVLLATGTEPIFLDGIHFVV